jgi:hypothetical protein
MTVELVDDHRAEELRRRRHEELRRRNRRRRLRRVLAVTSLVSAAGVVATQLPAVVDDGEPAPPSPPAQKPGDEGDAARNDAAGRAGGADHLVRSDGRRGVRRPARRLGTLERGIGWRTSTALGRPDAGRLVNGVLLPSKSRHFVTWDPELKRSPNRALRRHSTDATIRRLLAVVNAYAAAHPRAPRVVVGDLSRPRGGDFGRRYGKIAHVSHQNGLDVDIYYPRRDGRERAPLRPTQVDRVLSQELVNRFVAAGASRIFVGRQFGFRGPPTIVQPWPKHGDHFHVRFPDRR